MEKLRVVEAFGGIGAWAKALENLGIDHEVLKVIEFDESKMRGYNAIHGSNFVTSDITKVDRVPDHDLFCYSPPCQSYSVAGNGKGIEDERGTLFYDALRIIEAKKPSYAIMENVKGLTQKTHRHTFDAMLKSLEDAGYMNYWKVLNANDYNVAQNRDRVFVVSIRSDVEQSFAFPEPVPLTQKLTDILEHDAVLPILSNIYGGFGEKKIRTFYDYSPCIRTAKGGGHIPSVAIIEDFYKARDPRVYTEYSPTLRSNRTGLKVINGQTIRPLSPLECLRLQSFSDEDHRKLVDIGMSPTQIYKAAGDAINVTVVEELFKELLCPSVFQRRTREAM